MTSDRPDPFVQFAMRRGLELSTAELSAFPRDVTAPPGESQKHTLATLSGTSADVESVRVLFVTDLSDTRPTSLRDVLWWLASESWAIERAGRDYKRWAAAHSYAEADSATLRLFERGVEQAARSVGVMVEAPTTECVMIAVPRTPRATHTRSEAPAV